MGDVLDAARGLLGARLTSEVGAEAVSVILTEVEAYAGADDPASHAFRGPTPRNRPMFGPAGSLYVYRSYGIHWCMNIVVGGPTVPAAVLLRGGIVVAGLDVAVHRRGRATNLADGPGKLCQALGVTGDLSGQSLGEGPISIALPDAGTDATVLSTPRVGISKAVERPWRFLLVDADQSGSAT